MAGKEGLPKITLRYDGLFDFDGLYAAVVDWAKMYGYKWHEKIYKHKVPSPKGAEQEMEWEIERNVTEYLRFKISFAVHTWDQTEVEVEIAGKKKALTNARIYIIINGEVYYDWQERFAKGGWLGQKMGELYYKLIGQSLIGGIYWDQLYYQTWNLHSILKKYFDMQTKKYEYKGYLGEA